MRYLLALLWLLVISSCGNTFYITRHAEKMLLSADSAGMMKNDPPLSVAGELRAVQLRELLRNKEVEHIFSTNTKRTIATAQPLNELRGHTRINIYNSSKDSMDAFIERLRSIRKGNVLVVGHSNTVDDIVNKLCGRTVVPGDLKDNEYDNLFIVKRKGKRFVFKAEKYGTPSE